MCEIKCLTSRWKHVIEATGSGDAIKKNHKFVLALNYTFHSDTIPGVRELAAIKSKGKGFDC